MFNYFYNSIMNKLTIIRDRSPKKIINTNPYHILLKIFLLVFDCELLVLISNLFNEKLNDIGKVRTKKHV